MTAATDDRDFPEGWVAETAEAVRVVTVWRTGDNHLDLHYGEKREAVFVHGGDAELAAAALNHLQSGTCDQLVRTAGANALRGLADHLESTGHEDGIAADRRVSVLARARADEMEADGG